MRSQIFTTPECLCKQSTTRRENLGTLTSNPSATSIRKSAGDRNKADLMPVAFSGDTLIIGFPEPEPIYGAEQFELDGADTTLAEISIRELLSCLPTSDDTDDIRALDVAGQPAIMRSAVSDMVEAVAATKTSWTLTITDGETSDEIPEKIITMAQAEAMKKNLRQIRTETKVVQKTGTLDGVRTSRHIFYLIGVKAPKLRALSPKR